MSNLYRESDSAFDRYNRPDDVTGRELTRRERIERAQKEHNEKNPLPPRDERIHQRYWDGERFRSRQEREELERAEATAQRIVDHEVEKRLASQPQRPTNWAARLLAEYQGRSDMSPERRRKLETQAREIEKQIDQQLAAEKAQREREADPRFAEARTHASEFIASLPEVFHNEARVALALLDMIDDPERLDIYWKEAKAVRAKADQAKAAATAERQREVNEAAARLDAHFAEMRKNQAILDKEAEHGGNTDAK